MNNYTLENQIQRLQSDIHHLSNEREKYMQLLKEAQTRETILQNDFMRIKASSDNEHDIFR